MSESMTGQKVRCVVTAFGDAEQRFTARGTAIAQCGGWVRFTIWDDPTLAEAIEKGTLCLVEGKQVFRKYTNAKGEERTSVEITDCKVTLLNDQGEPLGSAPPPVETETADPFADIPF